MLSEKVKSYLANDGNVAPSEPLRGQYIDALLDIGVDIDSELAEFNLLTIGPTFKGRLYEIYNICWFYIYSDYESDIERTKRVLKLPEEYIPLDSFEAEGGFFFNKITGEVIEIELGNSLSSFLSGALSPKWPSFNSFLEWYFDL